MAEDRFYSRESGENQSEKGDLIMGLFGRKKQNTEKMTETVTKAVTEVPAENSNPGDVSLGR